VGNDRSDIANEVRIFCRAATDNEKTKQKIWNELVSGSSEYSVKEKRVMMEGFFLFDQMEVCEPFVEKFFEALETLHEKHSYRY